MQRFIHGRLDSNSTERLLKLKDTKYVVDKLHIQGHTERWCLENCHPKLFPELEPINTVVCEQLNFWLGRYKHIVKHMNIYRFNFFLYIILNEYNKIKINGKYEVCKTTSFIKKKENSNLSNEEVIDISFLFRETLDSRANKRLNNSNSFNTDKKIKLN